MKSKRQEEILALIQEQNIETQNQLIEALRERGVEVEYMVKDNEGHGFHNQENRFAVGRNRLHESKQVRHPHIVHATGIEVWRESHARQRCIPAIAPAVALEGAKQLPVVVNPHGGPWARDTWGYSSEVQFLCNRGYAVFQMNFRGSTGYGRQFLEASYKQ